MSKEERLQQLANHRRQHQRLMSGKPLLEEGGELALSLSLIFVPFTVALLSLLSLSSLSLPLSLSSPS